MKRLSALLTFLYSLWQAYSWVVLILMIVVAAGLVGVGLARWLDAGRSVAP